MFSKVSLRIAIAIAGSVLLLAGCGSTPVSLTALGAEGGQVEVITVKSQASEGTVNLTGIIDTENKSNVTSQLPGQVNEVTVKEGNHVKKGDVLVILDDTDMQTALAKAKLGVEQSQAAVDQAKIAYDNLETNYERLKTLYEAGGIAQKDLEDLQVGRDQAKKVYETALNIGLPSARLGLESAKQALAKTTIVSPLDGIVVNVMIKPGDNIMPSMPLATVISTQDLVLTGNIPENLINGIKIDQSAQVSIDSLPGQTFKGKVTFISPISIPTGQLFPVKIAIEDSNPNLKLGMTARALIEVKDQGALTVPVSAVVHRDGRDYVYEVKEKKAIKVPVQLGLEGEKAIVIEKGLEPGDPVIVSGDQVYEGMSVENSTEVQ